LALDWLLRLDVGIQSIFLSDVHELYNNLAAALTGRMLVISLYAGGREIHAVLGHLLQHCFDKARGYANDVTM
jgi:hypothetical protein